MIMKILNLLCDYFFLLINTFSSTCIQNSKYFYVSIRGYKTGIENRNIGQKWVKKIISVEDLIRLLQHKIILTWQENLSLTLLHYAEVVFMFQVC